MPIRDNCMGTAGILIKKQLAAICRNQKSIANENRGAAPQPPRVATFLTVFSAWTHFPTAKYVRYLMALFAHIFRMGNGRANV
jgi:hypothetical protein